MISLVDLLVQETKAALYAKGLQVATAVGLPVTSWQAGDPTRSLFHFVSEVLSTVESVVASFVGSGFLDHARGQWLTLLAYEVYGVTRTEATYATTTNTLTNTGGGLYTIEAGDLTFKNSTTDKTYHNTSGGTLSPGPGTTLTLDIVADEAGSDSSAAIGEIDDLVTTLLGVTCTNASAAVGVDEESETALRARCRAKLGALSPNGPVDAYTYVALTPEYSGTTNVTRARAYADPDTGIVLVYLAGPSGEVTGADVTAVDLALRQWALPLCVTLFTESADAAPLDVAYDIWIYRSVNLTAQEIKDEIEEALAAALATRPIGGDTVIDGGQGRIYLSFIQNVIHDTFGDQTIDVLMNEPDAAVDVDPTDVVTLGSVVGTVHFVADPS